MKIKNLIILIMVMILSTMNSANAEQTLKADALTKRIPAGTKLKLQLMDTISTVAGHEGDSFNTMLVDDLYSGQNIILPAGSVIRGYVGKLKPVRFFSRGAVVYLDFDHVVIPNGRQLPLNLALYNRSNLTKDGGIYGSKGYGDAIKKNWSKTAEITVDAVEFGSDISDGAFTGANYIIVPICAVGGAFGGGVYFAGSSVVSVFQKGDDVILTKGSILDVVLTSALDITLN